MKLTKSTLKRLIKEEISKLLDEKVGNWWDDDAQKAGETSAAMQAADEMRQMNASFQDAGADALDAPETREMKENLKKIQADVEEYIKRGEFEGARKHVNAAWKSGAFGKNPEFAKAQWRRLRRMVANAKRKAGRRKPVYKADGRAMGTPMDPVTGMPSGDPNYSGRS